MAKRQPQPVQGTYGIGEWYGKLYTELSNDERRSLVDPAGPMPCCFRQDVPQAAPKGTTGTLCNKKGGICSLRRFPLAGESEFGPLTTTCPNRFLEGGKIFRFVGEKLLGTSTPLLIKEVPFLARPGVPQEGKATREDVGRIDMVVVKPDSEPLNWCALEMQAVYLSGANMGVDLKAIGAHTSDDLPLPHGRRRPDFRSCGPKRLLPQLQTKVPTLRQWGKKMAVIIDRPFFDALGAMDEVPHLSNCDIAWFIVRYEDGASMPRASLELDKVLFTTLERAVEGLTAGIPVSFSDFEDRLRAKMRRRK